jgi:predicted metal-dependent hydrolase
VSPRARNVTLKVNRANGLVVVVPKDFDRSLLPGILSSRQSWIERQMERFGSLPGRFEQDWPPTSLNLQGAGRQIDVRYRSVDGEHLRLTLVDNLLDAQLPSRYSDENLADIFVQWLKKFATQHCSRVASEMATVTDLKYEKVVVRGQKTRWGSYSSRGTLSLNYKLLFLPESLLRHVVLHELCHSVHMNHSADFWNLLQSFDDNAQEHDRQLADGWKYLPMWLE